jgi:hypothetical protein
MVRAFRPTPERASAPETGFLSGAAISHARKHVSRAEARFRCVSDTPYPREIKKKSFSLAFSLQIYPADRLFLTHSFLRTPYKLIEIYRRSGNRFSGGMHLWWISIFLLEPFPTNTDTSLDL